MKTTAMAIALALTAGAAMASPTIDVSTSIGIVMAAQTNGMTLYTFRKDRRGRSNCTGSCTTSWPPFLVPGEGVANDGSTIIKRADGTRQWATPAGMPLYFWAGDTAPGQTSGDGVGTVWDAARR